MDFRPAYDVFNTESVLKRIGWPAYGVFAQQMLSLAFFFVIFHAAVPKAAAHAAGSWESDFLTTTLRRVPLPIGIG
jgi:hypothetical protein